MKTVLLCMTFAGAENCQLEKTMVGEFESSLNQQIQQDGSSTSILVVAHERRCFCEFELDKECLDHRCTH